MNTARSDDDSDVLARRSAQLEPELSSASAARRLLVDALREADREDWIDSGTLALSEVVTNAALHAHTPISVLIEVRAERLCVEVEDRSPALPRERKYDEEATTGRGMSLVATLTESCGVRSLGSQGKVVWFTLAGGIPDDPAERLLAAWDLDADWPDEDDAPQTKTIVFEAMPATLWLAARQHHDAILREMVLYLAEHDDLVVDIAAADMARSLIGGAVADAVEEAQRTGTARPALPAGHPAPLPPVPEKLTLHVDVPLAAAPAYDAMRIALNKAELLAANGKLLARPGLPEIVAVREWACDEVLTQLAGGPATAWQGTDQPRFETAVNASVDDGSTWDDAVVRESERGVVAADEANRIVAVSRPLAALLGWDVDDLVGRRVVTLIPPALREAHVAGFTRHLTTGEAHVLGVPLILPVLRADGSEVLCNFMVERALGTTSRSVYVAWIDRAESD